MKLLALFCVGLMLSVAHVSAHAQVHACSGPGPGEVVVGQTDASNGVAPVPLCRSVDESGTSNEQATSLRWESRWGAIATDASHGALGSVTDMRSQRAAEKGAMDDCKAKGGVNCVLQMPYVNACAAMVVGDTKFIVAADKTADAAGRQGIEGCSKESTNCHVYFTACSPAALVH